MSANFDHVLGLRPLLAEVIFAYKLELFLVYTTFPSTMQICTQTPTIRTYVYIYIIFIFVNILYTMAGGKKREVQGQRTSERITKTKPETIGNLASKATVATPVKDPSGAANLDAPAAGVWSFFPDDMKCWLPSDHLDLLVGSVVRWFCSVST